MDERLDNGARVIQGVSQQLGQLDASSRRMIELGKDISSLQGLWGPRVLWGPRYGVRPEWRERIRTLAKGFLPVTAETFRQHLSGQDKTGREFVMGVYPMLQDETRFFLDEQIKPHPDQWAFLSGVRKIGQRELEELVRDAERRNRVVDVRVVLSDEGDDAPWTAPPHDDGKSL
jgi:hypothetical protein